MGVQLKPLEVILQAQSAFFVLLSFENISSYYFTMPSFKLKFVKLSMVNTCDTNKFTFLIYYE